ncbi:MAG: TonB-dependent receptor, partial [Mycobacteriales bacterium]
MTFGQAIATPVITIRGIGTENVLGGSVGGDPGVEVYTDGVVSARAQATVVPFYDIERVEVLEGPQGTLYGRNAIGGAINIITNKPTDEFTGDFDAQYGNLSHARIRAAFSGPLIDHIVSFRIAGYGETTGPDVTNIGTGNDLGARDIRTARLELLTHFTDSADLLLTTDIYAQNNTDPLTYRGNVVNTPEGRALAGIPSTAPPMLTEGQILGGTLVTSPPRTLDSDYDAFDNRRFTTTSGRLHIGFTAADLTTLVSYGQTYTDTGFDLSGTNVAVANKTAGDDTSHQFSAEADLVSKGSSSLDWIAGAVYFKEGAANFQEFSLNPVAFGVPPGSVDDSGGHVNTESYAPFGQVTYHFTDKLRVLVGLRYSVDRKTGNEFLVFVVPAGAEPLANKWHALTPKFNLSYDLTADVLLYATIARGYKSGGLNIGALQGTTYNPEYVWDYEAGLKSTWLDKRLRLNLSTFYYDYTDMQVNQLIGLVETLTNAAKSNIKGVELDLSALPADHLQLDFTAAYLDAKFTNFRENESPFPNLGVFNLAGNTLPNAPKAKINAGVQYEFALPSGKLAPRADITYTSLVYLDEFDRSFNDQPGWMNVNARVTWTPSDGRY